MTSGGNGTRLRKVLIVNTADRGGGAEVTAMSLLDGFQALGTETWLAVGAKLTDHPRVVPFHSSPDVDYRPHATVTARLALAARRRAHRWLGLEDFDHPYSRYALDLVGSRPDVLLCNNLHGGYFDLRALAWLSQRVPVILRLGDSWLFTGHCACPLGCSRWETGCGSCPDLSIPPAIARDATWINWRRKQRIFAASRLCVVTPSRWLEERARRSMLAPAVEHWAVVPNGVDLEYFNPGTQDEARRALGIGRDRRVMLFVATSGRDNPYKDFATIRAAMQRIARSGAHTPLELFVVGKAGPDELLTEGVRIRHFPYCASRRKLANLYRAADLYLHAAAEEAFCRTAAEALACGTPVVAAATGGIAEVVDHDHTGLLVRPGRDAELAASVRVLLLDEVRRRGMGLAGVEAARTRFDEREIVAALHAHCADATVRWRAGRPRVAGFPRRAARAAFPSEPTRVG
jgi:glycosyltransferase involved in cell wall biosynthesis